MATTEASGKANGVHELLHLVLELGKEGNTRLEAAVYESGRHEFKLQLKKGSWKRFSDLRDALTEFHACVLKKHAEQGVASYRRKLMECLQTWRQDSRTAPTAERLWKTFGKQTKGIVRRNSRPSAHRQSSAQTSSELDDLNSSAPVPARNAKAQPSVDETLRVRFGDVFFLQGLPKSVKQAVKHLALQIQQIHCDAYVHKLLNLVPERMLGLQAHRDSAGSQSLDTGNSLLSSASRYGSSSSNTATSPMSSSSMAGPVPLAPAVAHHNWCGSCVLMTQWFGSLQDIAASSAIEVELLHPLGDGSFGTVFKGRMMYRSSSSSSSSSSGSHIKNPCGIHSMYADRLKQLGQVTVAVKVVDMEDPESAAAATVEQEALQALVGYPAVVQLLGIGCFLSEECEEPLQCLVMECLLGPLRSWTQHHAPLGMPVNEIAEILQEICQALQKLHSGELAGGRVVVHGDLKPSNVLLADRGIVLADFGGSSMMRMQQQAQSPLTGTAMGVCASGQEKLTRLVGTRTYMSAELAELWIRNEATGDVNLGQGVPAPYGPAADIWSVGVLAMDLQAGGYKRLMQQLLPAAGPGVIQSDCISRRIIDFVLGEVPLGQLMQDGNCTITEAAAFALVRDFVARCCGIGRPRQTASQLLDPDDGAELLRLVRTDR